MNGRLIGIGTGPGDPELLTLKALRALKDADVLAYFAKKGRDSNARAIVASHIGDDLVELPLLYPVTTEIAASDPVYRQCIAQFYDQSAAAIAAHLDAGKIVAVLSEGDPFLYGSYMHLHVRLADRYPTEVVAGITSMSGCWSMLGLPMTQGDDVLCVLPGTLNEVELTRRISGCEAAVIMKVGRNMAKIRHALAASGRLEDAVYVERGTTTAMKTIRLADKPDDDAPYFSLVLVPGWSERS